MPLTGADVDAQLHAQLARITQPDLLARINELLIPIYCGQVEWDYGYAGQTYPCWIVAHDPASRISFAYCEHGFGPSNPWGMLDDASPRTVGMDACWYLTLEDAFRNSLAWDGANPEGYEVG